MTSDRYARISVVIPVYNEMATIEEILLRVHAVDLDKEIVIIDDGSTDGTREFERPKRRGGTGRDVLCRCSDGLLKNNGRLTIKA